MIEHLSLAEVCRKFVNMSAMLSIHVFFQYVLQLKGTPFFGENGF